MKNRLLITFLIVFTYITSPAQPGKLFSVDTELSSSLINQVYQDKDGIIWIATEDGLNRYDGSKFSIYKQDEETEYSLVNSYIRLLFEDSKEHLFIGLLKGLQVYDKSTDIFREIPLFFDNGDIFQPHITCMLERSNGEILIGTSGHGIYKLEISGKITGHQDLSLSPGALIVGMFEDREKNLWISTEDNGIFRFSKNGKLKKFDASETGWSLITCFCQDKEGNLLMGSITKGLFLYDSINDALLPVFYNGRNNLPVKTLFTSDKGEVYIGTDGEGIKIYDPYTREITESTLHVTTFDLNTTKVHSILQDKSGNFWLGIFQKGVAVIPARSHEFNYIGYKSINLNTIGYNCIMSLYKDHEGTLWVGADNDGLYALYPDGKQKVHFKHTEDPASVPSTIMCIYEDSDNNLWLGSYLSGITRLNRQTGECDYGIRLMDRNGSPVQRVYAIVEDNDKNLWIGTMGSGLYQLDTKTNQITHYYVTSGSDSDTDLNQVNHNWITSLYISHDNKLYIGTYDGMGCLDLATMNFASTFGTNRLYTGEVIHTIFEDSNHTIWQGTANGLTYIDKERKEFITYTTKNGLSGNVICGIREDNSGYLWLSTNHGISKMDTRQPAFINYYASDGLQGNEFSKRAITANEKGELFFGGMGGITWFNPSEITAPGKELAVRLTDFYVRDKPVRKGMKSGKYNIIDTAVWVAGEFHLAHTDNSFSIEFSTMEFGNPERITYYYTMNNYIRNKLSHGNNRVTFSDLAPGKYYFRVIAEDYYATSLPKEIMIIIHPAWYASGWAKLLYWITGCAILLFILQQIRERYHARRKMLEHQHAEQINDAKLQFFINIAHEIRTPMSLIINPLKKLISTDKDGERQKEYSLIHRNAERILNLINQLMDIRKIDTGSMVLKFRQIELIEFMQDLYSTFGYPAKTKNIQFTFHHEQEQLFVWIDPKNFDKIILNILSNAFKFTPEGGKIDIYLRCGEEENVHNEIQEYFEIVISDNGIGIQEEEKERIFERFYQIHNSQNNSHVSTGIGLHLTRSLVELHHGMIWVENNEDGKGCSFILRLPLGKNHLEANEIDENPDMLYTLSTEKKEPANGLPENNPEQPAKRKSKKRIVVVEDDEEIRKYICYELSAGHHVREYVNGKEALEKILKNPPDLVISDVMMPEMDGITLCRKIKQNVNTNHIPVILVTAKSKEEDNLEALETGADAYIIKPFNMDILKKNVEIILRNRNLLKNKFSGKQQEEKIRKLKIKSPDEKFLEKVMKIINDNLSNPNLNVEMIANKVGLSRVHLHRKLKELTNQSTRDLIRNVRLKQAATLLISKNLSVSEVAYTTGFTNLTHFSNAFKELYGMSPTTYIETHRKNETNYS